jgi:octaprenyl-diphosphate synthase
MRAHICGCADSRPGAWHLWRRNSVFGPASARIPDLREGKADILAEELGRAWENLGTGFQILDDVQNLSSGIPGKDKGDDIVEGKKSLPVILHAAEHPDDIPLLTRLFAEAAEKAPQGDWTPVKEAIALLSDSGSINAARQKGRALLGEGRSELESRLPEGEGRELLVSLVDAFREKMI